jgi:RND family efflux transporter MFP subunit
MGSGLCRLRYASPDGARPVTGDTIRGGVLGLLLVAAFALSGCKLEFAAEPEPALPIVRPVLTEVVGSAKASMVQFAGTIQPRVESDLAFQVLGRIITRPVQLGDRITAGQVLASLDPTPFSLAVQAREADLVRAKATLQNTIGAEDRQVFLERRDVVGAAVVDAARLASAAAAAAVKQAGADLDKAREQLAYTQLRSEFDGVVTGVPAEIGQTVAAGQRVMTIARFDQRDAVIDVPETERATISIGAKFQIELQSNASTGTLGEVREIAPQADSATRTYRVRMALADVTDAFLLGATITARQKDRGDRGPIQVPIEAVLDRDGTSRIWIVDTSAMTVATVAVKVGPPSDDRVPVSEGLEPGTRIVIAGVNSLVEGQAVKLLDMGARIGTGK